MGTERPLCAIVGRDGVVVEANDALCETLGLERDRLVGRSLDQLTLDPHAGWFARDLGDAARAGGVVGPSDRWFTVGTDSSFVGRFWIEEIGLGRFEVHGTDLAASERGTRRIALEAIIYRSIAGGMALADVLDHIARYVELLVGPADLILAASTHAPDGVGDDVRTVLRSAADMATVAVTRFPGADQDASVHDTHDLVTMHERLQFAGALRRGIQDRELEVHYQPIVAVGGGIHGAEALVRWRRSPEDLMPPDAFVPFAETTGLIDELGLDVLRQAMQVSAEVRAGGWPEFVMSVNVSARQFRDDLVDQVADLLAEIRLDPAGLDLEITESMLVRRGADSVVDRLHDLGLGITIDDFGTGYSSLAYLRRYPVASGLKIDASFVDGLASDEASDEVTARAIVTAVIVLGHSLGMHVTAEGVEHQSQLDLLAELGCDRVQGFLLSRPVAASDLMAVLADVAASAQTG